MNGTIVRTEADALREIFLWSKDRPFWQQDALCRILANGDLTDTDIAELTELCKDPSIPYKVLEEDHISKQKVGASTIALKKNQWGA